jgi:hypothetical protein
MAIITCSKRGETALKTTTLMMSLVLGFAMSTAAIEPQQVMTTNLMSKSGPVLAIAVPRGQTVDEGVFQKKLAETLAVAEAHRVTLTAMDALTRKSKKAAGNYCTIYCYNETEFSADVYFRMKNGPRKPWSSFWRAVTVPPYADGDVAFSLKRLKWYQFYFTVPALDATSGLSNEFKLPGKRLAPYGVVVVFYI